MTVSKLERGTADRSGRLEDWQADHDRSLLMLGKLQDAADEVAGR